MFINQKVQASSAVVINTFGVKCELIFLLYLVFNRFQVKMVSKGYYMLQAIGFNFGCWLLVVRKA